MPHRLSTSSDVAWHWLRGFTPRVQKCARDLHHATWPHLDPQTVPFGYVRGRGDPSRCIHRNSGSGPRSIKPPIWRSKPYGFMRQIGRFVVSMLFRTPKLVVLGPKWSKFEHLLKQCCVTRSCTLGLTRPDLFRTETVVRRGTNPIGPRGIAMDSVPTEHSNKLLKYLLRDPPKWKSQIAGFVNTTCYIVVARVITTSRNTIRQHAVTRIRERQMHATARYAVQPNE